MLANGAGLGYGLFVLDDASRAYLVDHIERLPDPLLRGSAWVTLWDNLLEGAIAPPVLFDAALRALPAETDEQNVQRILGYAARAYWRFLSPEERQARAGRLETVLRAGLAAATTQSQKSAWFNAYRDTVVTSDGVAWLERVWRREERVPGLTLAEPDEITLAMELAVREVPRWKEILDAQLARTQNPDRRDRLAFVMPALSADPAERERSFERFRVLENRRREVWVQDSLQYLNHPLRAGHGAALRPAGARDAAGDSAHRRHLLPDALDGADAVGPQLARGGRHRARVPGEREELSAAVAVDDPEHRRRSVPRVKGRRFAPVRRVAGSGEDVEGGLQTALGSWPRVFRPASSRHRLDDAGAEFRRAFEAPPHCARAQSSGTSRRRERQPEPPASARSRLSVARRSTPAPSTNLTSPRASSNFGDAPFERTIAYGAVVAMRLMPHEQLEQLPRAEA